MKQTTIIILIIGLCTTFVGCSLPKTAEEKPGWGWRIGGVIASGLIDSMLGIDDDDCEESEADRLWKGGYGFNNPNNERRRKGLPLKNFDGSIDK